MTYACLLQVLWPGSQAAAWALPSDQPHHFPCGGPVRPRWRHCGEQCELSLVYRSWKVSFSIISFSSCSFTHSCPCSSCYCSCACLLSLFSVFQDCSNNSLSQHQQHFQLKIITGPTRWQPSVWHQDSNPGCRSRAVREIPFWFYF